MWNKNCAAHLRLEAGVLTVLLACGVGASAAAELPATAPTPAQIEAAAAALRKDPNLGAEHTVRTLRWVKSSAPPPQAAPPWILGFFEYLGQAASLLLWIIGGIAASIAVVWIYRMIRTRAPRTSAATRTLPTSHVSGLDIRPDSLPDDVGAAALALLERGRSRDALSLLYRGALSRAVHRFDVAIEESFTEGEALRAVASRLERPRVDYFRELIGLWQRTVYAGESTGNDPIAALCVGFNAALERAPWRGL